MQAYLQFGDNNGPFNTVKVTVIEKPMTHHKLGLTYTATGYGSKLPSRYMIKWHGRWYRVYSICHSNVSTEYVLIGGKKVIVTLN